MPLAITLRLDPASAARVEAMWRDLAEAGIDDDRLRLGYPPHISLAILPDAAPVGSVLDRLSRVAAGWTAQTLRLCGFGLFPPGILWAAPVVTAALLACHAEMLAALEAFDVDPYYRAGAWVPHVTLAESLAQPGAALAALRRHAFPIEASLDRLDLLRFRPIDILASRSLP